MELRMVARTVGVGNERAVVQLQAVGDPMDPAAPGGSASIYVNDPDELDAFEEGYVYNVTFEKASKQEAGVQAQTMQMAAQAAAIQNSTNTSRFVTSPEQKVAPPVLPDGVVTEPRPSVVLEPLEGTAPPTAGVVTGPATNPTPATPGAPGTPATPATPAKK